MQRNKILTLSRILVLLFIILIRPLYPETSQSEKHLVIENILHLHMSSSGNDKNLGTNLNMPILSLQKAHDIIQKKMKVHPKDVIIHIRGGVYEKQKTNWYFTMPQHTITLRGEKNNIPIFDGKGMAHSWLKMKFHPNSDHSNLHIEGLQVQNYNSAIYFKGDKNNWHKDVSRNVVKGCRFINIGDKYSSAPMGYAAISLTNSRYNLFEDNTFTNIINNKTTCKKRKKRKKCFPTDTHIHAFYLSYYSSKNIIRHNTFESISGDAIRVRDFCNFNIIEYNTFSKVRRVYQDWYNSYRKIKNEDHVECYSWGNIVRDNQIGTNFQEDRKAPLLDIKTKFYATSGQKEYCRSKIFKQYHIDLNHSINQIHGSHRVIDYNNTWLDQKEF